MWVMAKMLGWYGGQRRREGQVFQLVPIKRKDRKTGKLVIVATEEKQFSDKWMIKVDPVTKKPPVEKEVETDEDDLETLGNGPNSGTGNRTVI